MSDKALVHVNPLDIEAPAPNLVFISRVINPRNIYIAEEARERRDRPLTRPQLKQLQRQAKQIKRQLDRAGYDEAAAELDDLQKRYYELRIQFGGLKELDLPIEDKRALAGELRNRINAVAVRNRQLRTTIKDIIPAARRYRAITERLNSHTSALEQRKLHNELRGELAKEVADFEFIIIERWAQLGYKYEYQVGKKRRVHKVRFSEINVTPDQIFLKIDTTFKTLFGFKSTLPQGVKVADLVSPETCTELSVSCQRQVQGKITLNNGVWLIINRLGTTDGLLNYLTLEQVLNKYDYRAHHALPIPVGVGSGRVISWVHIAEHPHFLIGGSTGGGKSNIENVLICTVIQKHSPSEVRFVLIDLKEGLEFRTYESIPHLLTKPITQVNDAARVLGQLEAMREERAKKFGTVWARTLEEYNARVPESERLPRIIIIFDEYAAIQIDKDMSHTIQAYVLQLLNKGRATGIHLIICTQNPSVDILPGPSKANMAFRLAGAMPTKSASMTILGTGDAAELPDVRGRMIAMVGAKLWPIQTPHAREHDIAYAIKVAKEWEKAPDIILPEPQGISLGFTQDNLIQLAIEQNEGILAVRKIHPMVKDEGISYRHVAAMVKTIAELKQVSFDGKTYQVVKFRSGWRLEEVS